MAPSPEPATGPGGRPVPTGWRLWVAGARPRTLPAAIVPVLVGTAAAASFGLGAVPEGGWLNASGAAVSDSGLLSCSFGGPLKGIILWRFLAAAIVALAIQVGTNYANDYSDGVKGTDTEARVGPIRLVGSGLASPSSVKRAAFLSFGVAAVAGLTLAAAVGWWLILVGLVCFAAGWFYTGGPRPYGYAGLGEVFVFVFFGLVATVGSTYVQIGKVTGVSVGCAVAVGFLATALLVINNLRDIPTDTVAGKRTLAVKLGDRRTRILYVVLMVAPYLIIPVVCGLGGRPLGAMSLFAIIFANPPILKVLQGATGPALIKVLGETGRVQLIFGVLLSLGLYLSAPTLGAPVC
jgi:1,4-dihydroxy-2-naphthoate octaprenyltransferase